MFQKSLQILVLAALVALAAIVAYASLELTGPDETLAEAQALADRGQFARAISVLNVTERDVRGDAERSERLWRLRADLATKLGQHAAALEDVRRLMRARPEDEELPLDEVRLLALSGDGLGALGAAERFLAKHPTHGRGLELAGEASQTLYQPALRETMQRLERELPLLDRPAGREAAWALLYRPAQDPGIETARARLAALHADDPRLQTVWQPLDRQLAALREQVQRSLDYYRGSLEAPGEPVAAFRAVALALDQSRRIDDLLAQCEIMRRRFNHKYVAEAGAAAAWSLLREGQPAAAVATTMRWLGNEPLQVTKPFAGLDDGRIDLMTARAFAAHRADDRAAAELSWRDAGQLWSVVKVAPVVLPMSAGLYEATTGAWQYAANSLLFAATLLTKQPVAIDRLDMLPDVATLALEGMARRDAPEAERQALLRAWQRARPGETAPLLANAKLQSSLARPRAAAAVLKEALAIDPTDDAAFADFVAAMRAHARDVGPDGAALLQQCFARKTSLPEVADPTGYIFCAEAALAAGAHFLARNCASAAIDAFPRARLPHELSLRVLLASDMPDEARKAAERLLAGWRLDRDGVALVLQAFAAAKQAPTAALPRAMTAPPSPELQSALLEQALADSPATAAAFATPALRDAAAPTGLRLLAARALIAGGDAKTARAIVDDAMRTTSPLGDAGALAVVDWLAAAATDATDADLLAAYRAWQPRLDATTPTANVALAGLAESLARRRPGLAHALAEQALAAAAPERRTGRLYAVAGRTAARLGDLRLAEERLTAALAFTDGQDCAEDLARLCLATGRPDRAELVRAAAATPRDIGLALRFDAPEAIAGIVAARMAEDPANLAALAALALFGKPSQSDWPPATEATAAPFAEALALAEDASLAKLAIQRLQELAAAGPPSTTTRLLLARALANDGRCDEAARLHAELLKPDGGDALYWREIARACEHDAYVPREDVAAAFCAAMLADRLARVAASERVAAELLLRRGLPADLDEATLARVTTALATLPATRRTTADDVARIADRLPAEAAVIVLMAALAQPQAEAVRQLAVTRLVALCERLAANPATAPLALATMRARLVADAAAGCLQGRVLRFVAASDPTTLQTDGPAWLTAQIDAIATGRDDAGELTAAIDALARLDGPTRAQATIEAALRRRPTALPLWRARAELAATLGDAREAARDLAAVLAHCDAPELRLLQLTLAAEARLAGPTEVAAFASLPATLRDGELGRYTQGMLALRLGRPDEALPLLAAAPARPDGMHLFARALAALQSRAADGPAQARAAFEQLQRAYPSSSLARNAGRFANQLALP